MMDVRRLVVFCILMETHQGILGKAPLYIEEKWNAINNLPIEYLPYLLDDENKRKYRDWLRKWWEG